MRSFLFEDIWMLSHKERRARRVEFHPKKNLILGRNHTGKSSLIKTLFTTLGARPTGKLLQWDTNTVSKVGFSIDGRRFSVLHQAGTRALIDADGRVASVSGDHAEWSAIFARTTGFNLPLTDKTHNTVPADPRCFFLPFYINQDGSWLSDWSTFTGIQQYKAPVAAILEYFSGIKPPEYYEAKALRDAVQQKLDELKKEKVFLDRARERVEKTLPMSGPKIDPKNFEADISLLTAEITELNNRQETLRDKAVRERELLSSIHLQRNLAEEALRVYEGDSAFLRSESREPLVCPVCNAEHADSFMDLLAYADDARSLMDITARLRNDAREIETRLARTNTEIAGLDQRYRKVSETLATRRGDLQFSQVVDSMGAERAFKAFNEEREALGKDVSERTAEHERLTDEMTRFTDKQRSKEIKQAFRESYAAALSDLNLPAAETSKASLASRPDLSGSGGPRSVLAYYAALWSVCLGAKGSFGVPLVVDSPNQQGQDDINLPKVIQFLSEKLPGNAQLILGSEIDTDKSFDRKIEFDAPYRLLDETFFDEADAILAPLLRSMYSTLQEPSR